MIEILHVITSLGAGGAEAMVSKVALELARRGLRNRVLSLGGAGCWGPRLVAEGLPVTALELGRGRMLPACAALAALPRPDVVQGWMYHGNLAAWALGRAWGLPFAWNIRATWDASGFGKSTTLGVMHLNRLLSACPCRILTNSQEALRSHREAGFLGAWEVIPNGFDLARFRPDPEARRSFRAALGLADTDLVVGMAARFHPMKDHGALLEAWARVAERFPTAHLVLAGTGVVAEQPWFARALAGLRRVHLLGERGDMAGFQAGLDLAVLSSAYGEAFPNVLGEAMACGVPCVATDVGDARAIVGPAGRIVPPCQPEALAGAMGELLGMPAAAREDLGRLGLARVRARFGLQAVGDQYEACYGEVSPR